MDVRIETQDIALPANSLSDLRDRVQAVMGHVSEDVSCLHLGLRDVNGAKGGRDKLCTVRAKLTLGGEIIITERSGKMPKALFRGLRRSRTLIRRELQRRRQRARQRRSLAFA